MSSGDLASLAMASSAASLYPSLLCCRHLPSCCSCGAVPYRLPPRIAQQGCRPYIQYSHRGDAAVNVRNMVVLYFRIGVALLGCGLCISLHWLKSTTNVAGEAIAVRKATSAPCETASQCGDEVSAWRDARSSRRSRDAAPSIVGCFRGFTDDDRARQPAGTAL
jgi:hypothetical protein